MLIDPAVNSRLVQLGACWGQQRFGCCETGDAGRFGVGGPGAFLESVAAVPEQPSTACGEEGRSDEGDEAASGVVVIGECGDGAEQRKEEQQDRCRIAGPVLAERIPGPSQGEHGKPLAFCSAGVGFEVGAANCKYRHRSGVDTAPLDAGGAALDEFGMGD